MFFLSVKIKENQFFSILAHETSDSSISKDYLGHFLVQALKFIYFSKKTHPEKISYIFSINKIFLYFRKWNFLASRLKNFFYFLGKSFSYILGKTTFLFFLMKKFFLIIWEIKFSYIFSNRFFLYYGKWNFQALGLKNFRRELSELQK